MVLYLVSNNLVIDDIVYETDETLEEKKELIGLFQLKEKRWL